MTRNAKEEERSFCIPCYFGHKRKRVLLNSSRVQQKGQLPMQDKRKGPWTSSLKGRTPSNGIATSFPRDGRAPLKGRITIKLRLSIKVIKGTIVTPLNGGLQHMLFAFVSPFWCHSSPAKILSYSCIILAM